MGALAVQMVLSLFAIVMLMLGISYVVKRFAGIPGGAQNKVVNIEILGQKHLHPKRSLHVVRISETVYVIGSSEQGLQLIGQLDDPSLHIALEKHDADNSSDTKLVLNARNLVTRLTHMGTTFPLTRGKQQ